MAAFGGNWGSSFSVAMERRGDAQEVWRAEASCAFDITALSLLKHLSL